MFKPRKSIIILSVVSIIVIVLFLHAREAAHRLHRDPEVLMNRYYLLRQSNPEAANNALLILLQQDKNHVQALEELSQIYLQQHHLAQAKPLLAQLHQLKPEEQAYTFELASLYYEEGNWDKAQQLLDELKKGTNWDYKLKAQTLLSQMDSYLPFYQHKALVSSISTEEQPQASGLTTILLNYFYTIQHNEPEKAAQLLSLLDTLTADNTAIPLEMGYLSLQRKENKQAISHFLKAYALKPNPELALQLAYLYASDKQESEAAQFFLLAMTAQDLKIKRAAAKGYAVVNSSQPSPSKLALTQIPKTHDSLLLDQFYLLKKHNKQAAWELIQQIITQYPNNLTALKEAGFLAIDLKQRNDAIRYFSRAYELCYQPDLAMQLGYLYDEPNGMKTISTDKYWAYHYFNLATRAADKQLALRAQNAMTNLSGLQTKVLPPPYFSEVFFDPFSQSRFGITVRPLVGRLGIEHDNRWQSKTYFVFRRTQDNKSENAGQVPQIYEDNVQILGVGEQITPFAAIPLVGFFEAGRAYDLVYRDRNRWRNDVRAGLMYYNEFGAKPAYFEHITANAKYYSTVYGDVTYFSRYKNNIIATVKTHQGLRLWQYHSTMLNVYLSGRVIEDTNRDFFNNIAEVGPGIGFIPSNRYKIELRYEHINGMYLPVGNSTNPYGKYYINNLVQLFFYTKL
ncbi:tetratricopeptide repeat protein [Legionella sp. km772]|uniref:tetratricopeptide repeat protein n=1 Tax=Legionella sp. km772 TaxID=2498111 RepID=UPI000F8EC9A0|nr:tetratricopeptide repeat protein [Legionella sp. km772]RUR13719.1 hypothetical protein ELY15_01440 [Legionella sp. km772]